MRKALQRRTEEMRRGATLIKITTKKKLEQKPEAKRLWMAEDEG